MTDLAFRPAIAGDMGLVYGSWLSSFRMSHHAGLVPMATYGAVYTEAIRLLLARPAVVVTVAYHPGEQAGAADLYGWACIERPAGSPVVHYCYVIEGYRRRGLARKLIEAGGVDLAAPWRYSYRTSVLSRLAGKMKTAEWAPLCARDREIRDHGKDRHPDVGDGRAASAPAAAGADPR